MRLVWALGCLSALSVSVLSPVVSVNGQLTLSSDVFGKWMDSGIDTHITKGDSMSVTMTKILHRFDQQVQDVIHCPDHLKDLFNWFNGKSATSSPTTAKTIKLTSDDTDVHFKKTTEHYNQHVDNLVSMFYTALADNSSDEYKPWDLDQYPFFGFIPAYEGALIPGKGPITWSSPCFKENTASAEVTTNTDDKLVVEITFSASEPTSLLCNDNYLYAAFHGVMFEGVWLKGTHKYEWKVDKKTTGEDYVWDVLNRGIRVCRFLHNPIQLVYDLSETVQLFLQAMTSPIPNGASAGRNMYFLREYSKILPNMKKRTVQDVEIDESLIQSGDFFGIVRLDGLDPMLAWAMGSTTGHTTLAMRDEKGELFVTETTTNGAYWPTNGIQKAPFQQWLKQARAAGYNVVHAPLSPKYREKFNATNAWTWFNSVEGFDYGYYNMLWAWVDTLNDNYPCIPPEFKDCLVYDHIELIFTWLDLLAPTLADKLFTEAFNLRLGTENVRAPGLFRKSVESGIPHGVLPMIIEEDSWRYHLDRYGEPSIGESHVCCTFICKMWLEAGIFEEIGGKLNCNEFTNWDAFSLQIFDSERTGSKRPQQCIDADPDNELCQLVGEYTLNLNNYNSKPMTVHMAEKCASKSPVYTKAPDC